MLQLQGSDQVNDDFEDEWKKKFFDLEQRYNILLGQVSTHAQQQGINQSNNASLLMYTFQTLILNRNRAMCPMT